MTRALTLPGATSLLHDRVGSRNVPIDIDVSLVPRLRAWGRKTLSRSIHLAGERRRLVGLAAISGVGVAAYAVMAPALGLAHQGSLPLLAVFLASVASSVAGFAFSAICGGLLFHLLDAPVEIVQILLVCSIANQILGVYALRGDIVWRRLVPFVAAGSLGVPLGVLLLLSTSGRGYLEVFGGGLIAYCLYTLFWARQGTSRLRGAGDLVFGFLGGVAGGFAAFPGAFVVIWAGYRGWTKAEQRAVYQPFILIIQCLTLLTLLLARDGVTNTMSFDPAVLSYLPVSLLGTWCGLSVFRRLTDRQFATTTNLLLIVSGALLIV